MVLSNSSASSLFPRFCIDQLTIDQVSEIQDETKADLQEVALTGTLKVGEKTLADLRKRKLIAQRFDFPRYMP